MDSILRMPSALRETIQNVLGTKYRQIEHRDSEDDDDAIALLEETDKEFFSNKEEPHQRSIPTPRSRKSYWYIIIGCVGLFLVLVALSVSSRKPHTASDSVVLELEALEQLEENRDNKYFHVVMPGTSDSSADFCKTLVSGAVLEYPTPWAIVYDTANKTNTTYSKIERFSAWMNRMPADHNEDIVAVIGNALAWFQVRPEVLIKRYFDIRERGDHRIDKFYGDEQRLLGNISSRVVFSSERECPLQNTDDCLEIQAEDKSIHYLSTNVAIGPLADMRKIWRFATAEANQTILANITVDENGIFTDLLRKQIAYRRLISGSPETELSNTLTKNSNETDEFGITLDFVREISYAADESNEGVAWLKHPDKKSSLLKLPRDIAASSPPFWSFNKSIELPIETTWGQVPFLTGVKANIIPSIIQRDQSSDPELSRTWWEKMWFHPHARKLLDNFAETPLGVMATVGRIKGRVEKGQGGKGRVTRYWSPHREKVGIKTGNNKFHKFNSTCGGGEDWREIFLDEGGRWEDPRSWGT